MTKVASPAELTLYCEVGERRFAVLAREQKVPVCAVKRVRLTDETWVCDNGYERTLEPVYRDAQGRLYKRFVTVDYFNNVSYLCWWDGRTRHFTTRPPSVAYDTLGRPLTDHTPPLEQMAPFERR